MMSIIETRRVRKAALIAALFSALAAGCASIPYQAMSDARQAIEAAEPVVQEGGDAAPLLERARVELDAAERQLHAGDYKSARSTAERAKGLAIEARETARSGQSGTP
jgi:hypothetical protein